ncbi:MAG: DUF1836 domain-containing protein [Eubacteriales bacterium]|nr:DUF1836 domain-containing protein [Eubacteriales bacterium]MDD3349453.1 DUF1836 domain-containing protein [Eubacteriales bacterium]
MKELKDLLFEVLDDDDIHASDLPAIDLYLDQIISLLEGKYSPNKRRESDKILTNTMIHNYRKAGLIKPVKGKRYSKEHILQMLIIFAMKNSLSIQDIKTVFDRLYSDPTFDSQALSDSYERALAFKSHESETLTNYLSEFFEKIKLAEHKEKENTPEDLFPYLLCITFFAGHLQRIAEQMVDEYFTPEPDRV